MHVSEPGLELADYSQKEIHIQDGQANLDVTPTLNNGLLAAAGENSRSSKTRIYAKIAGTLQSYL